MLYPADLQYSRDHEWLSQDGETAVIGITDYAQHELGDVVFINLPEVGDEVTAGESFGDVESVKAVSEIISPVSGTVLEINEELLDSPELLNDDPYANWIIKVENVSGTEDMMSAAEYTDFCETEA